jgi:MFS family permease
MWFGGIRGRGRSRSGEPECILVSAVVVAFRHQRKRLGIPLIGLIAVAIGTLSVVGLGLAGNWTVAMILVVINGYAGTMIGINMQTTVQLAVDDAVRGRVMSLWMVAGIGCTALGALLLGFLVDVFGLPATLVGTGVASLALCGALRLANAPGTRRVMGEMGVSRVSWRPEG